MRLRDKILMANRPVVVYEILPPRIIDGTIESYAEKISTLLSQTHIDAINIPEVHSEETRGIRPVKEKLRAEPREFGRTIQDSVGIEAIVNRVTVHGTKEVQNEWFRTTYGDYGIENIILVGGESGEIRYSGPSVIESSCNISSMNQDGIELFLGGICLPSRKKESTRLLEKAESGIDFFTTQVLYDGEDICKMLGHYYTLCQSSEVVPKRVLLSFAPISTKRNLEFLKWLGVEFPYDTEKMILEEEDQIKSRSIEVSMGVFNEVLNYISEREIKVPIGLNVEHIMAYNFEHSVELLQMMSKRYRSFCMQSGLFK